METRFEDEPESVADSPISGEEAFAPSPKKSNGRRAQKKVVTVPLKIDGGGGFRSKYGEVHPPPDNWSWRKYGQKPIKGSPYPRGYYRCSSSKGCPARKQVERSRVDPATLLITYSYDHNHPRLAATGSKSHRHYRNPSKSSPAASSSSTDNDHHEEEHACALPEPAFVELARELGWLCGDMEDGETTSLVGPMPWTLADDMEVFFMPIIREEDQRLFGDLGDLPESSDVFRWCRVETPCCGGTR